MGKHNESIDVCNKALELEPDHVNAMVEKARAFAELGNERVNGLLQ
jgi:hypothetical protein